MTYWMYGVGFVALVLIIGTIKATFHTRILLTIGVVAAMFYLYRNSKRR